MKMPKKGWQKNVRFIPGFGLLPVYMMAETEEEYRQVQKGRVFMSGVKDISYRIHTDEQGRVIVRRWRNADNILVDPDTAEYKWVTDKVAVLHLLKDGEEMEGVGNKINATTYWVYSKFEE